MAAIAAALPLHAEEPTQTTVPVTMTVTANVVSNKRMPEISQQDVVVTQGKERLKVRGWVPAQGQYAGLDLFILLDDASDPSVGMHLDDLKTFINAQASTTTVFADMVVLGAGMGLSATMFIIAMQTAVDKPLRGLVTSINIFGRNMGSAIGVSAQGAVLIGILDARLRGLAAQTGLGLPRIVDPELVLDPTLQQRLAPAAHEALRVALAQAVHGTFALGLVMITLGLAAVVMFMPGGSVYAHAAAAAQGGAPAD